MATEPQPGVRYQVELVPAGLAQSADKSIRFPFFLQTSLGEKAGRLWLSVQIGDAEGDFEVFDFAAAPTWQGHWRFMQRPNGASIDRFVAITRLEVSTPDDDSITKGTLKALPLYVVSDAVAVLLSGAARGLLDEFEGAFRPGAARALNELLRSAGAFSGGGSVAAVGPRRGRPPVSTQRKRQLTLDVVQVSQQRGGTPLYEKLSRKWSADERRELTVDGARTRLNVLVREGWLSRPARGAYAVGPAFTSGGVPRGERTDGK